MLGKIQALLARNNNPRVAAQFQSGLKPSIIDDEALDFFFAEAEKRIAATREAIDSLNKKAEKYISFTGTGIMAMAGLLAFAIDQERVALQDVFLAPMVTCSVFFLAAMGLAFAALGMSDVASAGNDPRYVMVDGYISQALKGKQKRVLLFRTAELYQTYIDINKLVIVKKANNLAWTYRAIWVGIAAAMIVFAITLTG